MQHILPKLPFAENALEPQISQRTLEYHYGKHHRGYVNKLNELIPGSPYEEMSLEEIILRAQGPIFNNAAQAWNHTFYWQSLNPYKTEPKGELARTIEREFGSTQGFTERFQKIAADYFGSGWIWLTKDHATGRLAIESTSNAANPLTQQRQPLLNWDVWEHAYYLDYQNDRAQYLRAIPEMLNWDFASQNYALKWNVAA